MDASGMSGRNAVITGSGSGIGRATSLKLAQRGARVACIDRSGLAARTTAEAIEAAGGEAAAYECDVSHAEAVHSTIERIVESSGPIHILFNNAGIAVRHPVQEEEPEEWDRCMAVNVRGIYLASRYAVPHMTAPASIVNTASVTGLTGVRNRAAYSASKGAIVSLTRNMALDLAARGIRVNCVCPGFVVTPLLDGLLKDEQRTGRLTELHPLGRLGTPDDVANAVAFLVSDEASWITGVALPVDGGFTAGHAADI
jgi:NAD(P)-dependent dehydrogenase (short-subunit alcohol dehydrogenase family)